MSEIAIGVEGLGKQYRIGVRRERYKSLRDTIAGAARSLFSRNGWGATAEDTIWALKDVSFEINRGDVVGVIGRNGAGKSTLLKILSRITEPTKGRAEIHGRVGSLLEVGTGFHPELTGRENIYLNGAILGMKKTEIDRKFDEMVAFAEVEKFIDTTVKHYSTGMYLRLAFSVAAHLDSETLLVDEVLAVGDFEFQKKCLGKMGEVGKSGRTVLFVSHNMPMVLRLCDRAILLSNGLQVAYGSADEIAKIYLHSDAGRRAERVWQNCTAAPGDDFARLKAVRVLNDVGSVADTVNILKPICLEVEYWNLRNTVHASVSLHFVNEDGIILFVTNDFNSREWHATPREPAVVRTRCHIPGNFLSEGTIYVLAAVCSYNPDTVHALERDAVAFQVVDRSTGEGVRGPYGKQWQGVIRPMLSWQVETTPLSDTLSPPSEHLSVI